YRMSERFDGELVFALCRGKVIVPGDARRPWCDATTLGTRLLLVPGRHGELHLEPQRSALRDVLAACLRGEPPEGVDARSVFDRSFRLAHDALVRDDGAQIAIKGFDDDGYVDHVRLIDGGIRV